MKNFKFNLKALLGLAFCLLIAGVITNAEEPYEPGEKLLMLVTDKEFQEADGSWTDVWNSSSNTSRRAPVDANIRFDLSLMRTSQCFSTVTNMATLEESAKVKFFDASLIDTPSALPGESEEYSVVASDDYNYDFQWFDLMTYPYVLNNITLGNITSDVANGHNNGVANSDSGRRLDSDLYIRIDCEELGPISNDIDVVDSTWTNDWFYNDADPELVLSNPTLNGQPLSSATLGTIGDGPTEPVATISTDNIITIPRNIFDNDDDEVLDFTFNYQANNKVASCRRSWRTGSISGSGSELVGIRGTNVLTLTCTATNGDIVPQQAYVFQVIDTSGITCSAGDTTNCNNPAFGTITADFNLYAEECDGLSDESEVTLGDGDVELQNCGDQDLIQESLTVEYKLSDESFYELAKNLEPGDEETLTFSLSEIEGLTENAIVRFTASTAVTTDDYVYRGMEIPGITNEVNSNTFSCSIGDLQSDSCSTTPDRRADLGSRILGIFTVGELLAQTGPDITIPVNYQVPIAGVNSCQIDTFNFDDLGPSLGGTTENLVIDQDYPGQITINYDTTNCDSLTSSGSGPGWPLQPLDTTGANSLNLGAPQSEGTYSYNISGNGSDSVNISKTIYVTVNPDEDFNLEIELSDEVVIDRVTGPASQCFDVKVKDATINHTAPIELTLRPPTELAGKIQNQNGPIPDLERGTPTASAFNWFKNLITTARAQIVAPEPYSESTVCLELTERAARGVYTIDIVGSSSQARNDSTVSVDVDVRNLPGGSVGEN